MYRALGERYGWTPAQVGQMTWPQIRMYLAPDENAEPGDKQLKHFTGPNCMEQYANWQRQLKQVI